MSDFFFPEGVRFSCIQCGRCCQDLRIPLTPGDYQRHSLVDWSQWLPASANVDCFEKIREKAGKHSHYFGWRPEHGCVFLAADRRCLVHCRKGYNYKALACKAFPFKFIAVPGGIQVALKFHCPAVIANQGILLTEQKKEIRRLFSAERKEIEEKPLAETVKFYRDYQIPWDAFTSIEAPLRQIITLDTLPFVKRILFLIRFGDFLKKQALGHKSRGSFGVAMDPQAILQEITAMAPVKPWLAPGEKILFVQFFSYLGAHFLRGTGAPSWRLWPKLAAYKLAVASGWGKLRLRDFPQAVSLSALKKCPPWQPDLACRQLLQHYFYTRLISRDYFGGACFELPFTTGLNLLALTYPLIVALARLESLSYGRSAPTAAEVKNAIYFCDFCCYASDIMSGPAARISRFMLDSTQLIEKLVWYYYSGHS